MRRAGAVRPGAAGRSRPEHALGVRLDDPFELAYSMPRSSATKRAVWATLAAVSVTAHGWARDMASVGLHEQQLARQLSGGALQVGRLGVRHVARERAEVAALHGLSMRSGAEKQCRITAGSEPGVPAGARRCRPRPRGCDHHRRPRRASSSCASNARRWSSCAGRSRGSSRALSRRLRGRAGAPPRSISSRASSSKPLVSCGCRPTIATTSS